MEILLAQSGQTLSQSEHSWHACSQCNTWTLAFNLYQGQCLTAPLEKPFSKSTTDKQDEGIFKKLKQMYDSGCMSGLLLNLPWPDCLIFIYDLYENMLE